MPKKEKVLITGATGIVGANVARHMVKEGHEVHIITRESSSRWRLSDILNQLSDHAVSLEEKEKLFPILKVVNPSIILHFATYGGFPFHRDEEQILKTNIIGTTNLIKGLMDVNYKCFINTGSSSEYGPKQEKMKESDICEPINFYGVTKAASTFYASYMAKREKKPIINLRLFSPFGPYDDKTRLMAEATLNALQNKEINLANPKAVRDYIYMADVIDLYLKVIEKAGQVKGEVFNVGSGKETSIEYAVNKILELSGSKSKVNWGAITPRASDTQTWEADMDKTTKTFSWKPKYSIDEGIKETVNWFRANLSLYL